MKELSVEEKAKRYDEAIKKAKSKIKNDKDHVLYEDDVIEIFPELAGSEDERIKDCIGICLTDADEQRFKDFNTTLKDFLDWLHNQGEQNNDKIVEKAKTQKQRVLLTETDGSANIDWDCRSLDDVKTLLKCGLEFIRTIEANKQILTDSRFGGCSFRVSTRYDKGIKQGEQKPNPYSGTSFEYNGHIWGVCARDNGVEILIDGHIKGRVFTNDSNAKEMFIKALERVEEQNDKGYKLTDCDKNSWWEDFKAYTSCTIEQKPAEISNVCEFSIETWVKIVDYVLTEHNGIGNYLIDPEVKDTAEKLQKKYKFDAASEEWDRVYRKGLDAGVNKGRAEALREQKPVEWSEEDTATISRVISIVKWAAYSDHSHPILNDKGATELVERLKSFKERVLSQPKQELSDEDQKIITELIGIFETAVDGGSVTFPYRLLKDYIRILKSCLHQSNWKPSDRELGAILVAIGDERQKGSDTVKELLNIYQHLKKLREG